MNAYIWNLVSISVISLFVYPFLKFVDSGNLVYIWVGIAVFLVDQSTKVIKALTHTSRFGRQFLRPCDAHGCDLLCTQSMLHINASGFPSGHAATSAFFFTLMYLMSSMSTQGDNESKHRIMMFGSIYVGMIVASRYVKKCHNELQLLAGVVYGAGVAILLFKFIRIFIHPIQP